jgi:hypothetical protein
VQIGSVERPVPFTVNRAQTELVRARQHLDAARGSLQLALEIFGTLSDETAGMPISALERALGQMEEAEAVLWESAE